MKYIFILLALTSFINAAGQNDLILEINDTVLQVTTGKKYEITVNGKKATFIIRAKDTLSFSSKFLDFKYTKEFKPAITKIDEGIEQIMLMTSEGTGILIQQYSTMDPSTLNEMMLNEVTKESINYGFEMKREDYTKKLKSGQTIKINKAVLKYKDETNIYEIFSLGKKDEGLLLMTMRMDEDNTSEGKKMIDLMWSSLLVK